MRPNRLIATGVAACLLAAPGSMHATLQSVDDPFFGPGSITRDTATALDWLDVPLSTSLTFAEAVAEFGPDGRFRGMRHATGAEITQLFVNAGIPVIGGFLVGGHERNFPVAMDLIALVGATTSQGIYPETLGFYAAAVPGRTADLDFFGSGAGPAYLAMVGEAFRNPTFQWPQIGHWMVREVPEPSAVALLAVGLAALGWRLRKRGVAGG